MKIAMPMHMPRSVVKAVATIWEGVLPPNIGDICYTYGDTLFTATPEEKLERHLLKHEEVHTKQQGNDPDTWWNKVGRSPIFRYEQELEAYRKQYQYYKLKYGKGKAFEFAKHLANDMASPMYGNMCTEQQALQDILRP